MITTQTLILLAAAYFIGSMPFAIWIGQLFYGIDIREHGSGNAGATNALRVLGKKAGFTVLALDVLKGIASVMLARISAEYSPVTERFTTTPTPTGLGPSTM